MSADTPPGGGLSSVAAHRMLRFVHDAGGPRRRRHVAGAALVPWAGLFAFALAIPGNPPWPLAVLLIVPVGLLALELGAVTGALAATSALASFVAFGELTDAGVPLSAYLCFALAFGIFALALGGLADAMREARAAQRRASAAERAGAARLRESEEKYRRIVETSHDLIWTSDLDGRITFINEAVTRILGLRPGELIGRPASEMLKRGVDVATVDGARERVHAGESVSSVPLGLRARDGREVNVLVNIAPRFDAAGELVGVTGTATDVSARRRAEREAARHRELAQRLLNSSVDGIFAYDHSFRITAWNPGMEAIFGLTATEVLGCDVFETLPFIERTGEDVNVRSTLDGFAPVSADRRFHVDRNGRSGHVASHYSPLRDADGRVSGGLVIVRDLSASRNVALALRDAHEQFTQVFENAPIGMALVELDAATGAKYLRVNQKLCAITGRTAQDLVGVTLGDLATRADELREIALIKRLLAGEIRSYRLDKRFQRTDGTAAWATVSVSLLPGAEGGPRFAIKQIEDITARKHDEERIRYLADHDAMTGLYNRARFESELARHVGESARSGTPGAVMTLDLDNFKYVNDTLGHSVGDELVRAVARLLRTRLSDADAVARFGADEFAILLAGDRADRAEALALEIVQDIRDNLVAVAGERYLQVTASIGVTPISPGVDSADDILARADVATYEAKQAGKDRVHAYRDSSGQQALMAARMLWRDRVRKALRDDRFELYLQPILDLRQDRVTHHEVLLRMHGDGGEIFTPNQFIPAAEHFRLMTAVDRWVVRQSIALGAHMAHRGIDTKLEVNLSGLSLDDEGLLQHVQDQLRAHGLDPARLIFEVTETAAISNLDRARRFIEQLKSLGCSFALDDFGSGFGSFYYLKYLDFDYLKIDGDFIRSLPRNNTDQLVVRSLVETARGLGKQTIAEFVEDQQTLDLLRDWHVDLAQGYHIGRPVPASMYVESMAPAAALPAAAAGPPGEHGR